MQPTNTVECTKFFHKPHWTMSLTGFLHLRSNTRINCSGRPGFWHPRVLIPKAYTTVLSKPKSTKRRITRVIDFRRIQFFAVPTRDFLWQVLIPSLVYQHHVPDTPELWPDILFMEQNDPISAGSQLKYIVSPVPHPGPTIEILLSCPRSVPVN